MRLKSPIKAALSWFTRKFQEIVGDLPKDIQAQINNKVAPQQAVNNSFQKQGIFGKLRQRVTEVIEKAAGIGLGQKPKPMPELYTAWDASKMRLSEKLHGTDAKMRAAIVDTIREQLKLGKHAKDAALALYDGYNTGKHVVRQQQLPVYMQKIVNLARRGELTDEEKARLQRLIRRAEAQTAKMGANGAPNKALKTAYNQLLQAVDKGAGKALERGIKTAVEEKSRYVAERIARTEAARAWAEAFHARYKDDEEVLAYKWQLGSRHPNFDVCDMYAEANLYGLGKGIFPKDKCPALPAHPHCLCHLTPIYKDETDLNGQRDRVKQGGDAGLSGLTHAERCKVLGIDGATAWEHGAGDWRENMRGYSPEMLGTRLTEAAKRGRIEPKGGAKLEQAKKRDRKVMITDVAIDKVPYVVIPGWTVEQNIFLWQVNQDVLRSAMKKNNSDEVACVYNRYTLERTPSILGDTVSVDVDNNIDVKRLQNKSYAFELVLSHNHPSTSNFSFADIDYFIANDYLGLMTVVTNQGEVYALRKTSTYDYDKIQSVKTKLVSEYSLENQAEMAKEFLKRCREGGVEYVKGK